MRAALLAGGTAILCSCNTVGGFGEDMAAIGRTVSKVATPKEKRQRHEDSAYVQPFDPAEGTYDGGNWQ